MPHVRRPSHRYASVLSRPRLVRLHGRSEEEVDRLLTELAGNAIWCEAPAGGTAPDANDNHLWALLASWTGSRLVTGDRLPAEGASAARLLLTPRDFVNLHKSR